MLRVVLIVLLGFASISGCGSSHQGVRVESSTAQAIPQQNLDNVAASFFNSLFGANR